MADTETAVVHLSEEGVVIVRIRDGARQSLEDARTNLAAAVSETAGRRRPLLVDIRTAQPLEAEARHHYSGQTLVNSFSAIALLVDSSPFGRMMGNVYLRVARPGIPTQLFTDESRALEWLIKHRPVTTDSAEFRFDSDRVIALMKTLERVASGEADARLPISARHDELDAIAYGINVLAGELSWAGAQANEAHEEKAADLRAAVASAEARSGAMLKAIPDLMFILLRDGTYVDYHARDPTLLFVPPEAFLGRTVRDVLPSPLAEVTMDALERACHSDDPVVVEYELPMDELRFYEARIVSVDADHFLTIVRDVTESKRASDLNRDLARRLIASQEIERQRLARELHDDVSQRLALLNLDIDRVAEQVDTEELQARIRELSAKVQEIGNDLHDMCHQLHPSALRIVGFVTALQSLCDSTSQQRNLHVTFTHGAIPPSLDADVSLCLYRIVQEALHNAARHSQAREGLVSVTCDESHITLQIADSGVGFDPKHVPPAGLGLVSMRERAAALQGQLSIDAAPGRGTNITVRIPLGPQAAGSAPSFLAST